MANLIRALNTRRYGNADQISRQLGHLRAAVQFDDTQAYVQAWCQLNHLRS